MEKHASRINDIRLFTSVKKTELGPFREDIILDSCKVAE